MSRSNSRRGSLGSLLADAERASVVFAFDEDAGGGGPISVPVVEVEQRMIAIGSGVVGDRRSLDAGGERDELGETAALGDGEAPFGQFFDYWVLLGTLRLGEPIEQSSHCVQ